MGTDQKKNPKVHAYPTSHPSQLPSTAVSSRSQPALAASRLPADTTTFSSEQPKKFSMNHRTSANRQPS